MAYGDRSNLADLLNDTASHRDAGVLYRQYAVWLRSRLASMFGAAAADDLSQETWARVIPHAARGGVRHPRAYLLRVARNVATDLRSAERRRDAGAYLSTSAGSSDRELELSAREAILSLPQPLRDVFVLSRFGGLTNAEIAERLGIRPKTVEWRMTKALAHCAAQLRR
jgi:RNA polymerase sigma factor (sigma-70 family)